MCQNPITSPEGHVFACRRCDQCISIRRFDWVARAMAESHLHKHTISLCLTYGDATQEQRDGAAMFRYSDIQAFLNRLRQAIWRKYKSRDSVRYLAAGEQGDRNGRCHWHLILYSDIDLTTVGVIGGPRGPISVREDIITSARHKPLRRSWSIWPYGFVTFQEADYGGISYALSYALKDQFTAERSRGTNRETRVETFATGMFRMSKRPPIGTGYIDKLLVRLLSERCVLPKAIVKIDGMKGFWWPRAKMREYLLTGLKEINDQVRAERGRDAPQWSSLIASVKNSDKDLEMLGHGTTDIETFEDIFRDIKSRDAFASAEYRRGQTAKRCGSTVACTLCLRGRSLSAELAPLGIDAFFDADGFEHFRFKNGDPEGELLKTAQKDGKGSGINSLCFCSDAPDVKSAFPLSSGGNKNCETNG